MDNKTLEAYFEKALEEYEQTCDTSAFDYDDLEQQCKLATMPQDADVAKIKEVMRLYLTVDKKEHFYVHYELERLLVSLIKKLR